MPFSIDSKLGDLLDNEATKAVLEKHLPGISEHPQLALGRGFSFRTAAQFAGGVSRAQLEQVDAALKALG